MKIKFSVITFSLLFMASFCCQSNDNTVSVGVAHFPPYSIVEGSTITGVEVEIMRESLAIMGYNTTFISYPYGRLPLEFSGKKIDSTIVTLKNFHNLAVYYSEVVLLEYQTVAVHLKEKNLKINSINDLENVSVLAHQRAHLFYGAEYKRITEVNKETFIYNETARQESQVKMLLYDRIDVIVLANEIFTYLKSNARYDERDREIVVSKIFGNKFGFHNAFWDKKVRDDFNTGLSKIKINGTYHQILTKYLQLYEPDLQSIN